MVNTTIATCHLMSAATTARCDMRGTGYWSHAGGWHLGGL